MELLTHEECARIHGAALEVLRDVGVRVDNQDIIRLLQDAGATVTDENVVHIPTNLVEWALRNSALVLLTTRIEKETCGN